MDDSITRVEYEEFRRRLEERDERQNQRIKLLEEQTKTITDLAISVKELAVSVKQLAVTQKDQSCKLEKLEERDGEAWRRVVGYLVTAVVGIIAGFVFKQIGM